MPKYLTQEQFHDRFCKTCEYAYYLPGYIYLQCSIDNLEECPGRKIEETEEIKEDDV